MARIEDRFLRALAIATFIVYCGWNLFWLGLGQWPPALFLALTGLPAPTTGGIRSVAALLAGRWRESLHLNPGMAPILLILFLSLALLAREVWLRRPPRLPGWIVWSWCSLLATVWVWQIFNRAALS